LRWLELLHTSVAGQHLGTNLAIDLAGEALAISTIAKIVFEITSRFPSFTGGDHACAAFFHDLIPYSYAHREGQCLSAAGDRYVHAIKLSAALRFHFQEAMGLDFDLASLAEVERKLAEPEALRILEGRTLRGGHRGTVWVSRVANVRAIITGNPDNPSLAVRRALGLGGLHIATALDPAKVLVIEYPDSYHVPTYQPTVCDAFCTPGTSAFPYLSAKTHDQWGRTWSMDGVAPSLPERIHRPADDFPWAEAAGEILTGAPSSRAASLDYAKLIDEGELRLQSILDGSI
jgi:hypothetical protein